MTGSSVQYWKFSQVLQCSVRLQGGGRASSDGERVSRRHGRRAGRAWLGQGRTSCARHGGGGEEGRGVGELRR